MANERVVLLKESMAPLSLAKRIPEVGAQILAKVDIGPIRSELSFRNGEFTPHLVEKRQLAPRR